MKKYKYKIGDWVKVKEEVKFYYNKGEKCIRKISVNRQYFRQIFM